MYSTIEVARGEGGVATLTFNRPEVRNALNEEMVREIRDALRELAGDRSVRALVLTGAGGKAFLGGADIAELHARRRDDALRQINSRLFREVEQFPWPTVAAIRGFALGGGCEMAIACDLRVCGETARLGQPEVSLGIIPGAGATYRLPRLIGLGRARELVLTGRMVDAAEALSMGLVNRVVPDERVVDEARVLAAAIVANSPTAVRLAKAALNSSHELSTDAGMLFESTAQAVLFEDEEKERRMREFLEKRGKRS